MYASQESESDLYPSVGELWNCVDRAAVISGNSFTDDGCIWVMDWNSGDYYRAEAEELTVRNDRKSLTHDDLTTRFAEWARKGSADAMWWLAWWFEGTNHHKSVWYYVAAMRADQQHYAWAQERVMSDAQSACMRKNVPTPDLTFLEDIPEMQGLPISPDWQSAVAIAGTSTHLPAKTAKKSDNLSSQT